MAESEKGAKDIPKVAVGFTASRESVLDAIYKMGVTCCAYSALETWSDRCDCKFGFKLGHWPAVASEQTGCPELRSLYGVIAAMIDEEWVMLTRRAGGFPSGFFAASQQTMENRLHAADAAARMAADQIAKVRNMLTLEVDTP